MGLKKWEELPEWMKTQEVLEYYEVLQNKRGALAAKRVFDIVMSLVLTVLLLPVMIVTGIVVGVTSPGGILFRQVRVTSYGRRFRIYKFRTMVAGAPQQGAQVTVHSDARITGVGKFLRRVRLDELPQLFNVLRGDMSFVGTRPEVEKYVERYSSEMYATLLMPAGVTSEASIEYKDEERLLSEGEDVDDVYVNQILPAKMKYNLAYIRKYSFFRDFRILWQTVAAVLR